MSLDTSTNMAAGNVPPSTTVNVQTLSNAIAVFTQALQSASVAPNTNQANPSSTGANQAGPSQPSGGCANR